MDGNSPGFWDAGTFRVFTSSGIPVAMQGSNVAELGMDHPPAIDANEHFPMWIESIWRDDDGTVYAWYHHEPGTLCDGKRTAPKIGALVSYDRGASFRDLGIVLESGGPLRCDAGNDFFADGHGDISVILDRERQYFYFLFTNYSGPLESQGIVVARMAFEDRANPVNAVWKLHAGAWTEPGIGGAVSAVYPAKIGWENERPDSFWGPAVHWNTAIERYVILLNHACCESNWPQEGVYVAFAQDLADMERWTKPARLMTPSQIGAAPGFYPQVFGLGAGESDTLAGQLPRLFIQGVSNWTVYFDSNPPADPESGSGHSSAAGRRK